MARNENTNGWLRRLFARALPNTNEQPTDDQELKIYVCGNWLPARRDEMTETIRRYLATRNPRVEVGLIRKDSLSTCPDRCGASGARTIDDQTADDSWNRASGRDEFLTISRPDSSAVTLNGDEVKALLQEMMNGDGSSNLLSLIGQWLDVHRLQHLVPAQLDAALKSFQVTGVIP